MSLILFLHFVFRILFLRLSPTVLLTYFIRDALILNLNVPALTQCGNLNERDEEDEEGKQDDQEINIPTIK